MPHIQKMILHVIFFIIVVGFGGLFFLFLIHIFALSNLKQMNIFIT